MDAFRPAACFQRGQGSDDAHLDDRMITAQPKGQFSRCRARTRPFRGVRGPRERNRIHENSPTVQYDCHSIKWHARQCRACQGARESKNVYAWLNLPLRVEIRWFLRAAVTPVDALVEHMMRARSCAVSTVVLRAPGSGRTGETMGRCAAKRDVLLWSMPRSQSAYAHHVRDSNIDALPSTRKDCSRLYWVPLLSRAWGARSASSLPGTLGSIWRCARGSLGSYDFKLGPERGDLTSAITTPPDRDRRRVDEQLLEWDTRRNRAVCARINHALARGFPRARSSGRRRQRRPQLTKIVTVGVIADQSHRRRALQRCTASRGEPRSFHTPRHVRSRCRDNTGTSSACSSDTRFLGEES